MNAAASQPSVREMLHVVLRYKRAIITVFVLPVIVAMVLAYSTQKLYQADSKVMIRAGREYVPALETGDRNAISPAGTMQEAIDTEVEILTSKDVLREVVDTVGINRLYPVLAGIEPPHPILGWLSELIGQSWPIRLPTLFKGSSQHQEESKPSVKGLAVEALEKDLKVKPIKLSNVIEVSFRNPDRTVASDALRQTLAIFQIHHIAAFSRRRSPVLEEQIAQNLDKIAQLEKTRAEYRSANLLFAAPEQRSALIQQRARSVQELQETKIRQSFLQNQIRYLGPQVEKLPQMTRLDTSTQPSPGAQSTERSLQELRAKEGLFATRFNANSPILQDLQASITAHEGVLGRTKGISTVRTGVNPVLPTLEVQLVTAKAELAPLENKGADLDAAIGKIDERLKDLSVNELRLLDLDRRIGQLELATSTLRQRLEDARFLDELDREHLTSVTVIESAAAPEKPVSPKKTLYGLIGLACGLMAAASAFLLALTFGNRFLSVEMVERVLEVPVVAVLPLLPRQARRRAALPIALDGTRPRIVAQ